MTRQIKRVKYRAVINNSSCSVGATRDQVAAGQKPRRVCWPSACHCARSSFAQRCKHALTVNQDVVPQLFFLLAAASNRQKPPEFVPASLWHCAMPLPRSIQLFAASTTRATAPPEQSAERLAVSASNRSSSYPSIGSQHRLPVHTEKPASSWCKEKKTCTGEGCSGQQPQEVNKSRS